MPDTPSIVIVKRFIYRGQQEEFSNRWHFKSGPLNSVAEWKTLADGLIAQEKLTVTSGVSFVRAYGYAPGIDHSVVQIDYTVPPNTVVVGTFSPGANYGCPGDVAATMRWATGKLNSRGKKIYCRKYMHGVYHDSSTTDNLLAAQKTVLETFGAKVLDGTMPLAFQMTGSQEEGLGPVRVDPYLTTRTLKRRGKRPLP